MELFEGVANVPPGVCIGKCGAPDGGGAGGGAGGGEGGSCGPGDNDMSVVGDHQPFSAPSGGKNASYGDGAPLGNSF
jgi:hypothetical protein